MADRLIVFGSGGHAKVIVEAALARTPEREIILVDDADPLTRRPILGIGVHGGRRELASFCGSPIIPAIGDNEARHRLLIWLLEQGHSLETVIHPAAVVATSAKIGAGTFVSAGAIIIAEAQVGAGAIVNTGASVDHDCTVGRAAHIGPGAHLCGRVRIGNRVLVGVGSSIRPNISVCDDVIIGAGSAVVGDIDEAGTYAGNPARRLR